jgi:hypothetical protein
MGANNPAPAAPKEGGPAQTGPSSTTQAQPKAHWAHKEIQSLWSSLLALVPADTKAQAQGIISKLKEVYRASGRAEGPALGPTGLPEQGLRKLIAEEVKKAIVETNQRKPQARTWADIAAGAPLGDPAAPQKVVPPRAARELTIRGAGMPAELAKRTPAQVIQAVNQASDRPNGAIAARKLPSGDIILTFKDPATKEWYSANREKWVPKAFGPQAREATRTFAILVKGVHRKDLEGVSEATFQQEISLQSVDKVKFRLPVAKGYTRATILIALANQAEATKACEEGLLWRAQLFDCEPYWPTLNPTQCFRCWKWGHIQRYCRKEALCPSCGTKAHSQEGGQAEMDCPTRKGLRPPHCPACGGKHSARDRGCPARVQVKAKAREAYAYRPRTFARALATGPSHQSRDNGRIFALDLVEPNSPSSARPSKRPRGRPSGIAVATREAAQDPMQRRLDYNFASSIPTQGFAFQASQPSQPLSQPPSQPLCQPEA